jgi:hypothetical protein
LPNENECLDFSHDVVVMARSAARRISELEGIASA